MSKRRQPSASSSKAETLVSTRKQRRKQQRQIKKQNRKNFLMKRVAATASGKQDDKDDKDVEAAAAAAHYKADKAKEVSDRRKESKTKAEKERERQRRKRLREDNLEEDRNLKSLEKKLKMNKKRGKKKRGGDGDDGDGSSITLPKAFIEDGLDFLLDACDAEKLSAWRDDDDLDGEVEEEADDDQSESDQEGSERERRQEEGEQDRMSEDEVEPQGDSGREDEDDDDEQTGIDEDEGDEDDEGGKSEEADVDFGEGVEGEGDDGNWEDIYGRTRDSKGNVVSTSGSAASLDGKYVPPALRTKLGSTSSNAEKLARLRRRCKGLLNRLAAANMSSLSRELEALYSESGHARADVSETLFSLLSDSLVDSPTRTPERLVLEHALLVGILHANAGPEVGGAVLQALVKKYRLVRDTFQPESNSKEQDNAVLFLSHLFTFKVTEARLVFDLLSELADEFSDKDVELIVTVLKAVGFGLRKADPTRLKELIMKVQRKSAEAQKRGGGDARVGFMLEVLMAIKNNNVRKIPNYDDEHQQFLLRSMKQWIRPGVQSSPLGVGLKDLLEAETRGRWWIVGSAWTGKDGSGDGTGGGGEQRQAAAPSAEPSYSSELLEKARLMRMNTDARRTVFCSLMDADDCLDAFERLVKLRVAGKQKEREVAFVVLDCCLQEKAFNPYYSELGARLAQHERKFMLAFQFALWDKIKAIDDLEKFQASNLADFTSHLLRKSSLPLSALKVVEFADMDKKRAAFLRKVLGQLLSLSAPERKAVFGAVAASPTLGTLREGLRLFMRHFMLKKDSKLREAVEAAEDAMMGDAKLKL